MRLACSSFLKLYNKGSEPYNDETKEALARLESFVQQKTFFGMVLKPIYDIIYEFKHSKEIANDKKTLEIEALLAEVDADLLSI